MQDATAAEVSCVSAWCCACTWHSYVYVSSPPLPTLGSSLALLLLFTDLSDFGVQRAATLSRSMGMNHVLIQMRQRSDFDFDFLRPVPKPVNVAPLSQHTTTARRSMGLYCYGMYNMHY